jgi:dTDP-4-amino-4,6-dideoxygalactose transaminase
VTSAGELALFGGTPILTRDAHRAWPIVGEGEKQAVARVLDRGILSGPFAPEVTELQREFAHYVGARHCLVTNSGTSALVIALAGVGVGAGDEVIVPAYSFVATPLAVLQLGATPVFADVEEETGCVDPAAVEAAITARTRAVMPVHMHGCPAAMNALAEVVRRHRLVLVEDAAQAHGALFEGRPVGAIGAAGGFSLQSSKNLPAGEGGLFVTNDDAVAIEAGSARNFGQELRPSDEREYDVGRPLDGSRALNSRRTGSMYRGSEFMAAFARAQLAQLSERTSTCQLSAQRLARRLADLPGVVPPVFPPGRTSVHHKFRVRLDPARAGLHVPAERLRDVMMRALVAEGLEVVQWQTAPLPAQPVFQRRARADGFPEASRPPFTTSTDLSKNYDPSRYPRTISLLAGSLVLFSQSCPLIAQTDDTVDRYAEAFERVWRHREAVVA